MGKNCFLQDQNIYHQYLLEVLRGQSAGSSVVATATYPKSLYLILSQPKGRDTVKTRERTAS